MERERKSPSLQRMVDAIQRANEIATNTALDELLDQMLDLFLQVVGAEAGTLYLYDSAGDELIFKVVKGDQHSQNMIGQRFSASLGIAGAVLRAGQPVFIQNVEDDPRWDRRLGELSELRLRTMYCLPLALQNQPVGIVQVFNLPPAAVDDDEGLVLLELLGNRMVSEIEKSRLLQDAQRRQKRLGALVDIISQLTTTLERDNLLTLIMNHARELLEVEATSVWELNEQRQVLELHVATGNRGDKMKKMTVPVGQGIIGHVVATGERVLVANVETDSRWNRDLDRQSGFVTRSILSVPLRSPSIYLGPERGTLPESIIGGAQALNKRGGGAFSEDDIELFEALAGQAATVLQLSRLYKDTQQLFEGVINVVTGAIDAKDPYTQGHSRRVSEFSVAIAEELELSAEQMYHVKIGGVLHDVGKIGIPDAILKKPARLTDEEMAEMKQHPTMGYDIMRQEQLRWLLREELPALLQHHERLDGRGYPSGLAGDEIALIGRIVAVADVFDALTSDRPYRDGMPVEEALAILQRGSEKEFDPACVAAFCRALAKGHVKTQRERTDLEKGELEGSAPLK